MSFETIFDKDMNMICVWLRWWPADDPETILETPFVDNLNMSWLEIEIDACGWEYVIDIECCGGVKWLIENGIAPFQPFCVRFSDFNVWECGWEIREEEHEWSCEVISIVKWDVEEVIRAWTAWINSDINYVPPPIEKYN